MVQGETMARLLEESKGQGIDVVDFRDNAGKEETAYSSIVFLRAEETGLWAVGATPLIPFKVNSVAFTPKHRRDRVWERAYHYFNLHRDEFQSRYHQRSNVESTFGAIKAKLGPSLRSKTSAAMINETLCTRHCRGTSLTP